MTHTYKVSGMTCSGCKANVQRLLSTVAGVKNVSIDLAKGEATIEMNNHVSTESFQIALQGHPKYQLSEKIEQSAEIAFEKEKKPWIEIYKPILLIFVYILGVTLLVEYSDGRFVFIRWMNHFMAGFFLVFSFFKLLNLKGFSESYAMYDIVAKKWSSWGYVYAFTELALGLAYLSGLHPMLTNTATFTVMTVSVIGVLQTVLNKRKIKCACLGDVFNLPMSNITIFEDVLMIGMSVAMFVTML